MDTKNDGIGWGDKSGLGSMPADLEGLQMRHIRQQIETELDRLDKSPKELLSDEELNFISRLYVR